MRNFLSVTTIILTVIGITLLSGYVVHDKIVKNELQFMKFNTYVECIKQNEKNICEFIIK